MAKNLVGKQFDNQDSQNTNSDNAEFQNDKAVLASTSFLEKVLEELSGSFAAGEVSIAPVRLSTPVPLVLKEGQSTHDSSSFVDAAMSTDATTAILSAVLRCQEN